MEKHSEWDLLIRRDEDTIGSAHFLSVISRVRIVTPRRFFPCFPAFWAGIHGFAVEAPGIASRRIVPVRFMHSFRLAAAAYNERHQTEIAAGAALILTG